MYSHHTRIYPKRDDVYRAEYPGPYYSTSSVYSYSPTSASDCPEHGRSRRKITVILTTSIILATLGVLSIAGVAAYLGILSKNISNNASQSTVEESYLQSGADGGGRLAGSYPITTTEENSELIFTTNDDLLGDALDGLPGDSLVAGDLTNNNRISSTPKSSGGSSSTPPRRIIEGHHSAGGSGGGSTRLSNPIISNNDLHMLHNPHMVTMRPAHDEGMQPHIPHHHPHGEEENPVRMFTEPSQTTTVKPVTPRGHHRQRYPLTNSHSLEPSTSTTTAGTRDGEEEEVDGKGREDKAEVIHLSHPENAKKPGEIESLLKEDHDRMVTPSSTSSTAGSSTTTSSTTTTTAKNGIGRENVHSSGLLNDKDDEEEVDSSNQRRQDGNVMMNIDEQATSDGSDEDDDNRSSDYDQSRLDGVSPTMISRLDQQQHPEMPFKPIHPIISSESDYGEGGGSTIVPMMGISGGHHLKNGKLPLKFDRISPEYYDNQPWTPLLDRPNLDKRPRVEVDLTGVGVEENNEKNEKVVGGGPIFSSTEPIIVWNSEEPEEAFGGGVPLEYPPKKGLHNITLGEGNYGGGGLYQEVAPGDDLIYGQGANFTVSTYYGYGLDGEPSKEEKRKGGIVMDEPMEYPMDNPVYPPEDDDELKRPSASPPQKIQPPPHPPMSPPIHQNEEAMNGFRPSNIPAYTILIPHIPNPEKDNDTTSSGASDAGDMLLASHLSPPEDYAANTQQFSKMDRMGVAADVEEEETERPTDKQQHQVTYNFEAIKTIPVPEDDPKEEEEQQHHHQQTSNDNHHEDDYMEDADIDELSETEAQGEPKIYRLDPDSVVDMVPDTLGGTTSKRPQSGSSSSSSTTSTAAATSSSTTEGKTEGTERSSAVETTNGEEVVDEDDVGGAGYVDDSFEQKQNELGLNNNTKNSSAGTSSKNVTTSATPTVTKDFDKEFSPASMELVIGPQEPDLLIKSTTDLIMSTLGSLNLIKTPAKPPPTEEEIYEKLRHSDVAPEDALDLINGQLNLTTVGGDPLFPPVRSYVGINQPLRPKPNRSDPLSTNHINKQFRFSEEHGALETANGGGTLASFPPTDAATTHSLQQVLSMMLGTPHASLDGQSIDKSRHLLAGNHPLIKSLLRKQNVTLVVANETGPPQVINLNGGGGQAEQVLPTVMPTMRQSAVTEKYSSTTPTTSSSSGVSHRDPKAFITTTGAGSHRDSKIDHAQFSTSGEVNHVPVPLILDSANRPSPPTIPQHLTAFPWSNRPPKVANKIQNNNSPVYKFVLKKGQSVEDLLKEIFSNYTTDPAEVTHHTTTSQETILQQVPVKLGMIASPNNPSVQNHPSYFKSLEVESISSTKPSLFHHVETTPVAHFATGPPNPPPVDPTVPASLEEEKEGDAHSAEVHTATSVVVHGDEDDAATIMGFDVVSSSCTGRNDTFKCVSSGKCIPNFLRCNFIKECEDNSDEEGCLCADFLRANGNARKLCDGIPDCADASDEYHNCEYCQPGQYICAGTRSCINKEQICDSRRDCQYGDDESDCVKIGGGGGGGGDEGVNGTAVLDALKEDFSPIYHRQGNLMVRKTGVWGKLCVESFSSVVSHWEVKDLARAVCKALTFSDYEKVEKIQDPSPNATEPYYELHYGGGGSRSPPGRNESLYQQQNSGEQHQRPSGLGFRKTECKSKLVVNVTCQNLQCGVAPRAYTQRARYRVTRIVGGANSLPGKWPWQAALYKNGEYQCGATLISSRWLLSAGHCFYHAQDDYWVARLGTLRRGATVLSPYEQVVRITHIFLHPEYKDVGFINDVSLLRLEKEVNFTDFVRPVCLPGKESRVRDGRMCTVVGWGQLFEVGRVFPDTLQEVQLPLISTQECRKRTLFLPLYKLTEQMFCAGFDRGGRDACLGDSGGPLMCPESDGRWSLYGVTSNGYGCARANRPGVYTKVTSYLDWIYEKMSQDSAFSYRDKSKPCPGHRCLLGECLDRRQVCNGIRDCIEDDGSDERGPNCTTYLTPHTTT